jgi:5-hydroxyisourate hydrolase
VSTVTTHVLDTARGRPAAGVAVRLERVLNGGSEELASAATDADGRVRNLGADDLGAGTYRLVFGTADYFAGIGGETFFPQVVVEFSLAGTGQHYHVPLLLSPYGYSTYRGS